MESHKPTSCYQSAGSDHCRDCRLTFGARFCRHSAEVRAWARELHLHVFNHPSSVANCRPVLATFKRARSCWGDSRLSTVCHRYPSFVPSRSFESWLKKSLEKNGFRATLVEVEPFRAHRSDVATRPNYVSRALPPIAGRVETTVGRIFNDSSPGRAR